MNRGQIVADAFTELDYMANLCARGESVRPG